MGSELSPETVRRVDVLFWPADREAAKKLLIEECGTNLPFLGGADSLKLERFRFAALKLSDGNLSRLEGAVRLAKKDWRDLLVAAGFANDVTAHREWEPKPAGEPSAVDPSILLESIHQRIGAILAPLGFQQQGDEWSRGGEVPQKVSVQQGLTSRIEVRFFLIATLDSNPRIVLRLPKVGGFADLQDQGYIFRAGGDPQVLVDAAAEGLKEYIVPLVQRFMTNAEVQLGRKDGTFRRHLPVDGQIWLF